MFKFFSTKFTYVLKMVNPKLKCSRTLDFPIQHFKFSTSSRDQKFWDEYSKTKKKGEKIPSLKSQEIKIYQTNKQWLYADRFSLKNTEFLEIIKAIEKENQPPFLIIDVREESEFLIYKFPEKNPV